MASKIDNGCVDLKLGGEIKDEKWRRTSTNRTDVCMAEFVDMPDNATASYELGIQG